MSACLFVCALSAGRSVWHENAVWQEQQEATYKQTVKDGGSLMKQKPGDQHKSRGGKSGKRPGFN